VSPFELSLGQFSGPLDLLLHLVRVNRMDIFDLDVAKITDEYLAFIHREEALNLAEAYHFLAMAASLVELKSRMLLPRHEDEDAGGEGEPDDPRRELSLKLAAYEGIKAATGELAERFEQTGRHWPRQVVEQLEQEIVYAMDTLSVYDLMTTFAEVLERPRFKQITIFREDYGVEQARGWVRERLVGGAQPLAELLYEQGDIFALIVTFVAVLEMIKEEEVRFDRGDDGEIMLIPGGDEAD
jgi:segregation and condensation protein A